jgi:acyl-coenzyme A synthetase/AMP-(fatty) acid ligase
MAATASADGPLLTRILRQVERRAQAPAIVSATGAVRYRELLALISNTVRDLHGAGIRPGMPVAITMGQGPMHLVVVLALARLGALAVPLPPSVRGEERSGVLRRFGVARTVTDAADLQGEGTLALRAISARGDEHRLDYGTFTPAGETPLRLAMTSGTTGVPKAVLQTHASFLERMDLMQCGEGDDARVLPPYLHITAALNLALFALCAGGCVVFPPDYGSSSYLATLRAQAVTHAGLPPAHLALMVAAIDARTPRFPAIRHLRLMGGTPSAALVAATRERFSTEIFLPYAIGELGVVSMARPDIVASVPGCSGRIAPGVRVEMREGELAVAMDGMPTGYFGPDAGDRTRFRDGWFLTRDRARVTADGLLFIEGRVDDILNIGGRKASPAYIEGVLEEHPNVREAAVFAAGEGVGGLTVCAAIVPSGQLDWRALHAFARARLGVLSPVRYVEAQGLPRNDMGKLLRNEIAARFLGATPVLAVREKI